MMEIRLERERETVGRSDLFRSLRPMLPVALFLAVPAVSGFLLETISEGDPTVGSVSIFGVPDNVVESMIGQTGRVADFVSISTGSGWVSGNTFLRSLENRQVASGNAYRIVNGCPVYDPQNPCQTDDVLTEGGVDLPLFVIESSGDISLVFGRDNQTYSTEFELNEPSPGEPVVVWPGRTGAVPEAGYIGYYVLENGIMKKTGEGGWAPFPNVENGRLRIQGQDYAISIVYIYSFPFDPVPGLAALLAVLFGAISVIPGIVFFSYGLLSRRLLSAVCLGSLSPLALAGILFLAWLTVGFPSLLPTLASLAYSGTVFGLLGLAGFLWSRTKKPLVESRKTGGNFYAPISIAVVLVAAFAWYLLVWRSIAN